MALRVFGLLVAFAAAAAAQDLRFKPEEKKTSLRLTDPLTGEAFDQPLAPSNEVAFTDRALRPVSLGDAPRLHELWVSPFTGFCTFPDPELWKRIHEKASAADKEKTRAALARWPRRYGTAAQVPALHRYALAEMTYAALGLLDEQTKLRIHLQSLWCALDEGNAAAERRALETLRPLCLRRVDDEGITSEQMLRASYLSGEIARRLGDAAKAQEFFAQAFGRIQRWKVGREIRLLARIGMAETEWRARGAAELAALAAGDDPVDAHVAVVLLVDRGAAAELTAALKGASLDLKKDVVNRAVERPHAALAAVLAPFLGEEDAYLADTAAVAIGSIRTPESVELLVGALAESAGERLVLGLAQAGTPGAIAVLARLAEEGSEFGERPQAAAALAALGGEAACRALLRHVAVAEGYNLSHAVRLAARAGPALLPPLRAALEAGEGGGGLANLLVLAAILGDAECRRSAGRFLASDDARVRAAAAVAMARGGEGKAQVQEALRIADSSARPMLLDALGYLGGGPEIGAALDAKTRADEGKSFLAAVRAAGRARMTAHAPLLRELLEDADAVVAAHAAHALVLLGERKLVLPLLETAPWILVSAVARGCGETGDASLVPALMKAYELDDGAFLGAQPGPDGEYDLPRREIPAAIRKLGGKQAEAFLKRLGA